MDLQLAVQKYRAGKLWEIVRESFGSEPLTCRADGFELGTCCRRVKNWNNFSQVPRWGPSFDPSENATVPFCSVSLNSRVPTAPSSASPLSPDHTSNLQVPVHLWEEEPLTTGAQGPMWCPPASESLCFLPCLTGTSLPTLQPGPLLASSF